MLTVKIMADIFPRDDDARCEHKIIAHVLGVDFRKCEQSPAATHVAELVIDKSEERTVIPLWGNVYVMNDAGKTISQFHPSA